VGLAEDELPSFQSIKKGDESREMQEERRNCFVAITRAQDTLTLTYAGKYFGWPKKPSRFLREMELL
jgi:DNA helicase-2/ATP-dependent DNA helicase PcrA